MTMYAITQTKGKTKMSGMQMLMSSLGIDPQMIMQSADEFKAGLVKLNADLEFIKNQNEKILCALYSVDEFKGCGHG